MAAGENRATILAGDGGVVRRYLLEGIAVAVCGFSLMLLRGKPQILVSRIGRWWRLASLTLLRASVWSSGRLSWSGGGSVVRRFSSASTATSLGSVVLRGLGVGRVLMNVRRVEALSGAVAAPMAGLSRVRASIYSLEMVLWKMAVVTFRA